MDSPEAWRWVWVAVTVGFALGEMATPGSFFLLPFAIGALLAAVLGFADVGVAGQWFAFAAASIVALAALRPVARRLDRDTPSEGIGSRRLIGSEGHVLEEITGTAGDLGLVRIDREDWRAESLDGTPIPAGASVRVADVRGTRVVVTTTKELQP